MGFSVVVAVVVVILFYSISSPSLTLSSAAAPLSMVNSSSSSSFCRLRAVEPLLGACCEQVNMRNNIVAPLFCHLPCLPACLDCLAVDATRCWATMEFSSSATGEFVLLLDNIVTLTRCCWSSSSSCNPIRKRRIWSRMSSTSVSLGLICRSTISKYQP